MKTLDAQHFHGLVAAYQMDGLDYMDALSFAGRSRALSARRSDDGVWSLLTDAEQLQLQGQRVAHRASR